MNTTTLVSVLDSLCKNGLQPHLSRLNRGLEKESLRVDKNGMLAQTPHPHALGAALTHPAITTDYSESLLEFVTPVHQDIDSLLHDLYCIHHFTYHHLQDEKLWGSSMPCIVRGEDYIPIAKYGSSNLAKMKEVYRRGLHLRYGSLMQTIAGIHFNFSMPKEFWEEYLYGVDANKRKAKKSECYFSLIRNFHRNAWICCFLFGASPAVCKSFLQGRAHQLQEFDAHSFYAPFATSLRLSGLGYNSEAQASININYNSLNEFIKSLRYAIQTPHPDYEKFGVKKDGEYQQLNTSLLQIENEFYADIRPKRIAASATSPTRALAISGVQYVEVRSVDLNPFIPIGIDPECIRFFDLLLLFCMFAPSPPISTDEWKMIKTNHRRVVLSGRQAGLKIYRGGEEQEFNKCAHALLDEMQALAELLDEVCGGDEYKNVLHAQLEKINDPGLTTSAKILQQMHTQKISFYEFAHSLAEQHADYFKHAELPQSEYKKLREQVEQSHQRKSELETRAKISFDEFLNDYYARQNAAIMFEN